MHRHVNEQKNTKHRRSALDAFSREDFLGFIFFARFEWGSSDSYCTRSEYGIAHHVWVPFSEFVVRVLFIVEFIPSTYDSIFTSVTSNPSSFDR